MNDHGDALSRSKERLDALAAEAAAESAAARSSLLAQAVKNEARLAANIAGQRPEDDREWALGLIIAGDILGRVGREIARYVAAQEAAQR